MRNYLNIIAGDFKRLTSSVVSIIILMGICIVPCLFAWFNILSNWDPFQPEATGRIPVAVVSEDKGAEMSGLYVNVGEKLTDTVAGNDMIDWKIMKDSAKAIEMTRAGDVYAAIIVPKSFSEDVMSISTGLPKHPELEYYENDKVNAIAPKITEQVKNVLQEEINAVFVGTLGKVIAEAGAAADAQGMDPQEVFGDLSGQMQEVSDKLEDSIMLVEAASGLSDAANDLLLASNALMASSEDTLKQGKKLLDAGENALPDKEDTSTVSASVKKEAQIVAAGLDTLSADLNRVRNDMNAYNDFVEKDLKAKTDLIGEMKKSVDRISSRLKELGLTGFASMFDKLSGKLGGIYDTLATLEKADENTWPQIQKVLNGLLTDIADAKKKAETIGDQANTSLDDKLNGAIADAEKTIAEARKAINTVYGDLDMLSAGLEGSDQSLEDLSGGLGKTADTLASMQSGFRNLSALFESLADSDALKDVNHLMQDDAEVIAARLASPIQMKTEDIYPIRTFGSVMAAFYTAIALWMGALFCAVMINTQVKRREGLRLHERFFGRYRLFMIMGLVQALIVTLGDLLYVGIQCVHPVLFVLAACVTSIAFTLIVYSIVFSLESIGLAACVIIMVLQVAGGGGTFPPEVLPPVFHHLIHFLPLPYAMDAMRECIGGMYDGTYVRCLGTLVLFAAVAAVFGLLVHRPMRGIIEKVDESKEESDLFV